MFYLNPQLLYLIPVAALVVALLVALNFLRNRHVQNAYGMWHLLSATSEPLSRLRSVARGGFLALAAGLLLLALARPVVQDGRQTIKQGTVSVIAVVDVSRSMAAMDYDGKVPQSAVATRQMETGAVRTVEEAGTRLEMVRHVFLDYLLPSLQGNQLGIVSYAGVAYPQTFLTRDTKALRWLVDRSLTISSAPGEGSAMGKALQLALAMFDADAPRDQEKVLVLFSDGGNDDKAALLAEFAHEARLRQIKVIVVAMGNVMPAKIPVSKLAFDDAHALALLNSGKRWYEENGQIEKSGLNAQLLQQVANHAGGQFIHMQQVGDLNLLDHLGKQSLATVEGTQELFPWALIAALVSLLLAFGTTHQWHRRTQS